MADEEPLEVDEHEEQEETAPSSCCSMAKKVCKDMWVNLWEHIKTHRNVILAIIGGQVLSLLLCGVGVTSDALEEFHDITIPTAQIFFVYFLVALIFGPVLIWREDFLTVLKYNWWKYIIIGIIDVESFSLIVFSYKYSTLTSIQILDSFAIVVVLLLSFVFLNVRYRIVHLVGVVMCIIGIVSLVLADMSDPEGSNPLFGDVVCLIGVTLYAISNVAQEYLVKNHSRIEWLALIGIVGSVVSGIQVSLLERHEFGSIMWNSSIIGILCGFVICFFLFYSLMPVIMQLSSAMVINLSLLTADIYTLLFGIYIFDYKFSVLYVVAFIIIIVGVFIYNLKPPLTAQPHWFIKAVKKCIYKIKQKTGSHGKDGEEEVLEEKVKDDENKDIELKSIRVTERSDQERGILETGLFEKQYGSNSNEGSEILKRLNNGDSISQQNGTNK